MTGTGLRVAAFVGGLVLAFGAAFAVGNAVTPLDRGTATHGTDAETAPSDAPRTVPHSATTPHATSTPHSTSSMAPTHPSGR
jgi:hypothetical protein